MSLRTYLGNTLIGWGRTLGRSAGDELAVTVSDHSIRTRMVDPDSDELAWDENLYRYGNLFVEGYANPIKPAVNHNKRLEDPDTVDVEEGDGDDQDPDPLAARGESETDDSDAHVELISSPRYRDYMRQDLISQLLNPREQWRVIAYAVIGLAGVMLINLFISMSAAGML